FSDTVAANGHGAAFGSRKGGGPLQVFIHSDECSS
ncbi:hypothetical protein A2U01_0036877, partial [Trifolium medium]|nr:hypothetical protein [Trifolium medium]